MEFLSWVALVQPLVIMSVFITLQYLKQATETLPPNELISEKMDSIEKRLSSIEEHKFSSKFVGELAADIEKCEKHINAISNALEDIKVSQKHSVIPSGEEITAHASSSDARIGGYVVGLALIQLVTSVIVVVLWYMVTNQVKTPVLNGHAQLRDEQNNEINESKETKSTT